MKLLLINPSQYDINGNLMKFKYGTLPPLNLLILASLAKEYKQIEIKIIDEYIENIPFEKNVDLLCINTTFTCTFPRVIDISKKVRELGITFVLGGTHSTCNYEECKKYADSIVIGEAEYNFKQLINDFLSNKKLKEAYRNSNFINLERLPTIIPRYDLININRYFRVGIIRKLNHYQLETSRGCPMQCTFCSVKIKHGSVPRFRSIKSVIEEIRILKKFYNAGSFSFADDNFAVNYHRTKNLLQELAKENIKFWCELSTNILNTPELIPLLKKAGCVTCFIGFESLNSNSLKSVKKYHNKIQNYAKLFNLLKKHDIPICAAFVVGFDYDDINTFNEIFNFLKKHNIQRPVFTILTPFPGTELYQQFKKEKRIITNNLSLYDASYAVFQPKRLTPNQLQEGYWRLYKKYYSLKEIFSRLVKAKKNDFIYSLFTNFRYRSLIYKNICPYNSGIKRIN